MVRWVWNFEIDLVSGLIDLHKTKLRKAMFKADSIQPNAPNLNSDGALVRSSGVDLLKVRLLDNEFFG
jgi:hypothetical protein